MARIHLSRDLDHKDILISLLVASVALLILISLTRKNADCNELTSKIVENYSELNNQLNFCSVIEKTYSIIRTPMKKYVESICKDIVCEPLNSESLFCSIDGDENFHRIYACKIRK